MASTNLDTKRSKKQILNLVVKKRRRGGGDLFCEIPTPQYILHFVCSKVRNLRTPFLLGTLLIYCVMLTFAIRDKVTENSLRFLRFQNAKLSRNVDQALTSIKQNGTEKARLPASVATTTIPLIKFGNVKLETSNRFIASISEPKLRKKSMSAFGAWMKDPVSNDDSIYIMDQYFRNTHVLAYSCEDDFLNDKVVEDYDMPKRWGGTGHAVYDGNLYFNEYNTSTIHKYSLSKREIVASKHLENVGFGNMAPYQWAGSTDIDFSADSDGLWIIYATEDSNWNLTVGKLNTERLEIEQHWVTNYRKKSSANAFIANGIVYTLHRYDAASTMLNYAFDTTTYTYYWPKIPFEIKFGSIASLDYNHQEKKLYAWDRGHQVYYDVIFK